MKKDGLLKWVMADSKYKKGLALLMSLTLAATAFAAAPSSEAAAKNKPSLSVKKKTLYYNATKKFTLKVKKNKVKKIEKTTWKTSNKKVAAISSKKKSSVVVTAKKKGKAKITATVTYKAGKKTKKVKLTCTVTAKKKSGNTSNTNTGSSTTPTPVPGGNTTPTPTPSGNASPTPAPGGDATPAPGGDATPAPGGDTTPTPGGDATPTPGGDATPTPGGDATPTPTPISGIVVNESETGTVCLDESSKVTVKFSVEDETISAENYGIKVNGTAITASAKTVGLATVGDITYGEGEVSVPMVMAPMSGWHKIDGTYKVELTDKDDKTLKSATIEYSLDGLSDNTDYKPIKTEENEKSKAWYKVEGTKMYFLTIVKQDKIHCDGIAAGGTTYAWWNGMNSQIYILIDKQVYSVGSHAFNNLYSNPIGWYMDKHGDEYTKSDSLIKDNGKGVRGYMPFGTFDDDSDTDRGCVLLNVVDLTDAGLTADTMKGQKITMAGYIGPNDGTGAFAAVNETEEYLLAAADTEE